MFLTVATSGYGRKYTGCTAVRPVVYGLLTMQLYTRTYEVSLCISSQRHSLQIQEVTSSPPGGTAFS